MPQVKYRVKVGAAKRPPSHTAQRAVQSMQASLESAEEPVRPLAATPLTVKELVFFDLITRARSRDEWARVELALAAQLARVMAMIEELEERMKSEPSIVKSDKGWPTGNPIVGIIAQLTGRQLRLLNSLKITGAAVGDPEDLVAGRKAEREAEHTIKRLKSSDEDSLLAM
jgi:hypothetical protein